MVKHSPEEVRQFVVDCRIEESKLREFSPPEQKLWDLAELSPFEQTRIITTNEKVLADPYLMRVYLTPEREKIEGQLKELGVPEPYLPLVSKMPRPYLHYFFRGDDDRAFHNHPWKRSLSFILIGGYVEHTWDFKLKRPFSRLLKPGAVNYLKRGTYHRVELLPEKKCWTLFVSTGRVQASDGQDWDFYDPETDTFTPWGEWTGDQARRRDFKTHVVEKVARVGDEVTVAVPPEVVQPQRVYTPADDPHAGHGGYNWEGVNGMRF